MISLPSTPSGEQLLVLVNTFKIGGKAIKIVTFQDIEPEIEQKEMESWQTISRIMAHEIMNSLTPLSSLTETGIMLLEKEGKAKDLNELSQKTIENLYTALKTISGRNRALTQFIGNYRQLSRLPMPEKREVGIAGMLMEVSDLYKHACTKKGISCSIHPGPENLKIMADESQVKQVLVNLVKNAIDALENIPEPRMHIVVKRVLNHVPWRFPTMGSAFPWDPG